MSDEKDSGTDASQTMVAKVIGLVIAMLAAWLAQKSLAKAWQRATGHEPPKAEDPGESRFGEVLLAAGLTSAVVAVARVLATRGTAKYFS